MSRSLTELDEQYQSASLVRWTTKNACRKSFRWLRQILGNLDADALTPLLISKWQLGMRDAKLSNASIRSYYSGASMVFAWAVDNELLTVNPFASAQKIRPERREVRVFKPEEIEALCKAAAEYPWEDPSAPLRWSAMIRLACESGLRVGEIWNLRWEDFDLDQELVHVRYRPDKVGEHWRWGTKSRADRMVPMFQDLLECLYRLQIVAKWRYPLLKRCTCERMQRRIPELTDSECDNPYVDFYREFRQVRQRANEGRKVPIQSGVFHQMRRTAITSWAIKGVPMVHAQYAAGHASMTTTRKHYIHVDAVRAVADLRSAMTDWAR